MQHGLGSHREENLGPLRLGLLSLVESEVASLEASEVFLASLELCLSEERMLPDSLSHQLLRRIDDNINNVTCIQAARTTNLSTGDKSFPGQ